MIRRLDPFVGALVAAALVASFVPLSGDVIGGLKTLTTVLIALLFFVYGTRLSTGEAIAGVRHWRLHLTIGAATYLFFPLLGVSIHESGVLDDALADGVLLLTLVPTTVQTCVVYTRIALGNVAGALVNASLSNVVGVFLTPVLVAWLMVADAHVSGEAVVRIVLQLFVPFVVGQLVRPYVLGWMERHDAQVRPFDRVSIVMVVFVAFAQGRREHVWSSVSVPDLVVLVGVCVGLLVAAYALAWGLGRSLGFGRADRIAILFCGSNKSLASGLPIASVLFAGGHVALLVLPLMLYHQLQIISGAWLAHRLGQRTR